MQATLQLNLSDALSPDELRALTAAAAERQTSIERLLFEAAKKLAAKTRRKTKA
jgi:hypothetical protein